jgi:hypothetical protein
VPEDTDQWWALVNMTTNLRVQEGQDIPLLTKRVLPCQEELRSMRLLFEYDFISCKEDNLYKTSVINLMSAEWM